MLNNIHKIKDRKTISIIVANYSNKHAYMFTKGEYIGQFEPAITEDPTIDETVNASTDNNDNTPLTSNSIALNKMLGEQVQPDILSTLTVTLCPHIFRRNLIHFYMNTNHSLHRMKLQWAQHH